jgi:hypothetical protein
MKKGLDFTKIRTIPLNVRKCKVSIGDFARLPAKGGSFSDFYESLPNILVGRNFKELVDKIVRSHRSGKMIIFMMGAHVIKCGLSGLIVDLMRRGIVRAVALNGAGIIHDTEIAMIGRTSEDVGEGIVDGTFGMAKETASFINGTINSGFQKGVGIGASLGKAIDAAKLPYRKFSILCAGYELEVPVTVHVAIGTDIIHQHPTANGEAIGEGSLLDFKTFICSVSRLDGGVCVNFGSAVILPEVFLKAVTVSRNLKHRPTAFTTANFDMINQYRPHQNILSRPTSTGGKGYNIIGHHEIMIPMLYRSIIEKVKK